MLSLPGTPVLRYGDEIGMGEDLSLPERESVRTPMQWSEGANGGFSVAKRETLILPVISGGEYGYERVNVDKQQRDPKSLLSWTERLLRVRRSHPEFGWGEYEFMDTGDDRVLAHRLKHKGRCAVAVHNLSNGDATVDLHLPEAECLEDLLTHEPHRPGASQRYRLHLGPYGYRWFAEERHRS